MVEFASVVDAVRCAVEVQRAMAERNFDVPPKNRIAFRIGINLGDIIVDEGDIYGDGVNIAALLEALAEPGGICVSAVVRDQIGDRLDVMFDDLGEQQVKNISRSVQVYGIGGRTTPTAMANAAPSLPLPDKPSLVVLPFQNMSGDPEQEYFADGMVEEITTAIARLPWLFVIARNSSFTYKGKAVDVKQVARELGVRYVLEGSVRKAGNRVRITGQLIEAASSNHIWGDRFDGVLDDIFQLQDQVASSVVGAIEPRLRQFEIERSSRKQTESLDAYDLYLRALAQANSYTEEGLAKAIVLLRQALALDPSYAPAAGLVGWCRIQQAVQGWGAIVSDDMAEALRLAQQAVQASRDDPDTLWRAGYTVFYLADETAAGEAAIDRALMLNPNGANAWTLRGMIHGLRNQPEAATAAAERAQRLSPFDPLGFLNAAVFAGSHLLTGCFEQKIEWCDRCLHDQPRFNPVRRGKIAALAHLGRMAEARDELTRLLAIEPGATIARFRANAARSAAPKFINLMAAGLHLAGLPEQ